MADDLEEVLNGCGITDVRVFQTLDDATKLWPSLAIVEGDSTAILDHPTVVTWMATGVPIVILNGQPAEHDDARRVYRLEQPFRERDLMAVFRRLSLL
ncbi:hypothetical protein [Jannaschia sp. AI_61]|uniref:hypothetical protein n=1 Tax=Jannaschia sp. AI_61 TaxID=2829796 RepID=UPI001C7CD5AB|nr:hypothetical protein [Jannaschia sp. AI_61]